MYECKTEVTPKLIQCSHICPSAFHINFKGNVPQETLRQLLMLTRRKLASTLIKKENKIFLIYKEIQTRAVEK
jgi:hypothetical protein